MANNYCFGVLCVDNILGNLLKLARSDNHAKSVFTFYTWQPCIYILKLHLLDSNILRVFDRYQSWIFI